MRDSSSSEMNFLYQVTRQILSAGSNYSPPR